MSDPLDDIHTNNAADNSDYGRRPTMTTDKHTRTECSDTLVCLREVLPEWTFDTDVTLPDGIALALIDVAEEAAAMYGSSVGTDTLDRLSDALDAAIRKEMDRG